MPIASTSQITVNTSTTGTQSGDAVLALGDGTIVVAWHDANSNEVKFRMQAPDGTWGTEQIVATSTGTGGDLDIVATSDGGFAIAYKNTVSGNIDTWGRAYDSTGTATTSAAAITNSAIGVTEGFSNAHMLADGSFVVVNSDTTAGDTLSMRLMTSSFASPGSAITIETGATVDEGDNAIVNLSSGNFAVFYAGGAGNDILAEVYDSTGTLVSGPTTMNTTTSGAQRGVSATTLSDGRVLVTWNTDTTNQMLARIFNADLTSGGAEFSVVQTATLPKEADTAQLADGRIVMVWSDSGDIKARLFSSTGVGLSDQFTVGDATGTETSPNVVALPDGRFTVTWTADVSGNSDIRNMTFDPSIFAGTSSADTYGGGAGADFISGAAGSDVLNGNDGNDKIYGGIGDDNTSTGLSGGNGDDKVYGDAGNDIVNGDLGNDTLYGGAGNDTIKGGDGNDTMFGGAGNDSFDGGIGNDTVSYADGAAATVNLKSAGSNALAAAGDTWVANSVENVIGSTFGADTITGSTADNKIYGLGGNDTINGDAGSDILDGGDGNDTINGEGGNDQIYGGAGNDTLRGGSASMTTNTGLDTFWWGLGTDSHDGADGIDTMNYSLSTSAVTADLAGTVTAAGGAAGDTFSNIENLTGSKNATGDTLNGTSGVNIIGGLEGNDTIMGRDGDDTLNGDIGNDTLIGGTSATVADTSTVGNQEDKLNGGAGNDTYIGGHGIDTMGDTSGAEVFRYITTSDGGGAAGVLAGDKISNFQTGSDGFEFKNAAFGNLGVSADLAAVNFQTSANNVALNTSVRFIYNTANDTLWYDANGSTNGAADAFCIADLTDSAAILIKNTDIAIIA